MSNAQRHDLHSGLKEVLGPQRAEVLMDYLPPVGWADVATKRDLDVGLSTLSAKIDTEVAGLSAKIDTEVAGLSAKIDLETANRRTDVERLEKSMEALKVAVLREQRIHLVAMVTVLSGVIALVNRIG
ncbi:MAG: hypothetical protein M5U19_06130 [Microthrixaceae bacterium]|nr:hypothetical protein [Microthrixaceae bacterium]